MIDPYDRSENTESIVDARLSQMQKFQRVLVSTQLSAALVSGGGATAAHATTAYTAVETTVFDNQSVTATANIATSILRPAAAGACWAQAGRVIGGFWGTLISSAATPWAAAGYFAAYLGAMSQEKKDKYGNFAC